jgi:hypothetical protein
LETSGTIFETVDQDATKTGHTAIGRISVTTRREVNYFQSPAHSAADCSINFHIFADRSPSRTSPGDVRQVSSPLTHGLVDGAIIQSGGCPSHTVAESQAVGARFATDAGCATTTSSLDRRADGPVREAGQAEWPSVKDKRAMVLQLGGSSTVTSAAFAAAQHCGLWNSVSHKWLGIDPDQLARQVGVVRQ